MSKLPFMQWYPADWLKDTRHLSLAAKGAYFDILNYMWVNEEFRGNYTATREGLIRAIGINKEDLDLIIAEIQTVCNVTFCNENVTFKSQRIVKEETARKNNQIRQNRHRSNQVVTPLSRSSNKDISYIRDQKAEGRSTSTHAEPPKAEASAPVVAPAPRPNIGNLIREISAEKAMPKGTPRERPSVPQGSATVKPYRPPETPLAKFLVGIKILQGYDAEDREWDSVYFARYGRAARDMLKFFKDDWKSALSCAEAMVKEFKAKGLDWGVEGLLRNAPQWRQKNARV